MKRLNFIYIFVLSLFFNLLFADNITVHNMSYDSIFVATYYQKGKNADIVGVAKKILPQQKIIIKRPDRKILWNRELFFSFDRLDLNKKLSGKDFRNSSMVNIGWMKGKTYYIAPKGENLKGYNTASWKVVRPTLKLFSKPFNKVLDKIRSKISTGAHYKDVAKVRIGSDLCIGEKDYLKKRKPIVKRAIEKFIGDSFEDYQTPNIAFCCSGGGYRAMISSLGSFAGAEKIGFLDCVSCAAGLSGSTWFISPWTYFGTSVEKYKKKLSSKVAKDLKKTFIDPRIIAKQIGKKIIFRQPVTLVDIYGSLLANKFFGDLRKSDRLNVHLSDLTGNIKDGKRIFPISTAVQPGPPFSWFEFTPYESGFSFSNSFIPTWSFDRKFFNGKSKDFAQEQSLGYFMGIWGSAFTLSFSQVIYESQEKMPKKIKNYIKKYIEVRGREETRVSPAKLNNCFYGMNVEFGKIKTLTLIDAGLDFNLPFPPLLRPERKVDIIIVCDASASAHKGAPAVRKAEKWARDKGLKFPKIDYDIIGKNIISVFKDETDKDVPTIIYMSIVKNRKFNAEFDPVKEIQNGFCNTFNFKYTPEQFELLSGLMEHNIIESQEIIKREIRNKIESKKRIEIELNE